MKCTACALHIVLILMMLGPGCGRRDGGITAVAHTKEIEEWQQQRLSRLTSDTGWLTLCGLFWLKEGANSVGSDSSKDVILPKGKTPARVGTIFLNNGEIRFETQRGVEVKQSDSTVTSIGLRTDETQGGPTILKHRTISFHVIKRGSRLGVRVKDTENPARVNFMGLEYFPVDLKWRFKARFEQYDPPHVLKIVSAANTVEDYPNPGALVFEHEGKTLRIDAVIETGAEDRLFIMFTDLTSGEKTYGGGRQLYTSRPDSSGHVVLDFNKAYNWPCVFTEYATCPIPPPQNRLPIRVEAGERMYRGHD